MASCGSALGVRLDWIGWAACHGFRADRPKNYGRVEELLRRGFSTPGVRDRDAIAEWLQIVCQENRPPPRGPGIRAAGQAVEAPATAP